ALARPLPGGRAREDRASAPAEGRHLRASAHDGPDLRSPEGLSGPLALRCGLGAGEAELARGLVVEDVVHPEDPPRASVGGQDGRLADADPAGFTRRRILAL